MPEVSERERKEQKAKRLARRASMNPKNPDDMKVIFRVTVERKRRLVELAEFYNVTMTDLMTRFIDVAWKDMERKKVMADDSGE